MMELSDQERDFIEMLRTFEVMDPYRVEIAYIDGAWDVTVIDVGENQGARGTGYTFDEAWANRAPWRGRTR